MLDTLGKKLEAARVKKQMTIEDVARATKIRPHSIADLERDDYSNFPSLAYAKGFVILYAKYLGVETGEINNVFGNPNEFGVSDYEYLSRTLESEGAKPHRPEAERSRGGFKALFIIVIILAVVGIAFYYGARFLLNVKRIEPNGKPAPSLTANSAPTTSPLATATAKITSEKIAPAVLVTPKVSPEKVAPAILVATPTPADATQISATPVATPSPTPAAAPTIEIRRAVPVFPTR